MRKVLLLACSTLISYVALTIPAVAELQQASRPTIYLQSGAIDVLRLPDRCNDTCSLLNIPYLSLGLTSGNSLDSVYHLVTNKNSPNALREISAARHATGRRLLHQSPAIVDSRWGPFTGAEQWLISFKQPVPDHAVLEVREVLEQHNGWLGSYVPDASVLGVGPPAVVKDLQQVKGVVWVVSLYLLRTPLLCRLAKASQTSANASHRVAVTYLSAGCSRASDS